MPRNTVTRITGDECFLPYINPKKDAEAGCVFVILKKNHKACLSSEILSFQLTNLFQ
jgi:hypothetical protein